MTTHRPIEVLPDRTAGTLAAWLQNRPEVEVICRDRAGAYADGGRAGAPRALQVADRWHLWNNLDDALDKTVRAHRGCLREPDPDPPAEPEQPALTQQQRELLDSHGHARPLVARTRERYAEVQALLATGAS